MTLGYTFDPIGMETKGIDPTPSATNSIRRPFIKSIRSDYPAVVAFVSRAALSPLPLSGLCLPRRSSRFVARVRIDRQLGT